MDELELYKKALDREKQARLQAEQLLEDKVRDIYTINQDLSAANTQLRAQQKEMIRTEKMASLGTLSAGMAHEINNPLAFVKSNFETLSEYVNDLVELAHAKGETSEDFKFIDEDSKVLFSELREGIDRVQSIVRDLKNFAGSTDTSVESIDPNDAIQSAIRMTSNLFEGRIDVETELEALPEISCNMGAFSQVFVNMLMNSAYAIKDKGKIIIKSWKKDRHYHFSVLDTGEGICDENLDQIFTPFFTTKPIGTGTGLGLSVAHGAILELDGVIKVSSKEGRGTRFLIVIPFQ